MTMRLLDLPWDVVDEILSRVPATSLRRLLCTCKRLNALFKDQDFITKHLVKAAKQCMVFMLSDLRLYSLDYNNVADPETLLSLNGFRNTKQVEIYTIFHCNGLLLCTTGDLRRRLVVWNPCTGQIKWIPFNRYENDVSAFVLGYENNKSCQTYKILTYSWSHYDPFRRVVEYGIYDFGSHMWRNLDDVTLKNCSIISKGVSLKGNTYWIADKEDEEDHLLRFDFSTERFKWMSIPFPVVGAICFPVALSVVRGERLSVLYSNFYEPPKIEIWMTADEKIDQTKDLSWRKFLSLDLYKSIPSKRCSRYSTTFFIDEEKKVAVLCYLEYRSKIDRDMVYVVGEDNLFTKIPIRKYKWPLIFNYVPSLVQIQQSTVMTGRKRKQRQ